LRLEWRGPPAASQYGAVDVYGGLLGGSLQVEFGFTPIFDEGFFDLIVSGTADGLSGAFSTIDIMDWIQRTARGPNSPSDSVGGMDVEIFRLHVARAEIPVPEPPCGAGSNPPRGSPDSVSSSGPGAEAEIAKATESFDSRKDASRFVGSEDGGDGFEMMRCPSLHGTMGTVMK